MKKKYNLNQKRKMHDAFVKAVLNASEKDTIGKCSRRARKILGEEYKHTGRKTIKKAFDFFHQ